MIIYEEVLTISSSWWLKINVLAKRVKIHNLLKLDLTSSLVMDNPRAMDGNQLMTSLMRTI